MSFAKRLDDMLDELEDILEENTIEPIEIRRAFNEVTLTVAPERLLDLMSLLSNNRSLQFDTLIDLCGVDYVRFGASEWTTDNSGFCRGAKRDQEITAENNQRFAVIYHLLSVTHNTRIRVKTFLDTDNPLVDSLVGLYSAANWFEREAFDMFGILFKGHPDLRRILTDYGFIGNPLRKDFPLEGHVEMRFDASKRRVVYEPVSVEARINVARVVREDNRYESGWKPVVLEEDEELKEKDSDV